jgi:hypothetical protein
VSKPVVRVTSGDGNTDGAELRAIKRRFPYHIQAGANHAQDAVQEAVQRQASPRSKLWALGDAWTTIFGKPDA